MTEASWTEANPLLPSSRVPGGDEPRSNSDSRIAAAARITAALVGSALLVAGAVVATSAKSAAPPPSRTSLSSQFKKDPTDVLIYKRTNPTTNPAEDCMWLTNNLGLQCQYAEMTLDGNDTSHGDWCGARAEAMAGNFNVHHIKDMFEPEGDVEKWVNRMNIAHEKTFAEAATWDAFMSFSIAYFTPFLKQHLERWQLNGLRYRAHSYKNPTDGAEILALFTYNPNTGEAVEIHGSAVSANATENAQLIAEHFSEVPADACELALSTGLSLEHMSQSWSDDSQVREYNGAFGGEGTGEALPFASVVRVSHPTANAESAQAWMKDNADLAFEVLEPAEDSKDSGKCKVAALRMKKFKDTSYTSVVFVEDLRFVDGTSTSTTSTTSTSSSDVSRHDSELRAQFLTHVQAVHDKRLGAQRGWDRWLDNHIGLMYQGVHLDDIAPTLVQNGVGFRAYRDVYKMDSTCLDSINDVFCGSLWCGGHSALGVEFHSFFDKDRKFFNGDFAPTYMDFCDPLTNRGNTDFFMDDGAIDDW